MLGIDWRCRIESINTALIRPRKTNQGSEFPETNSKQHKSPECKMPVTRHKSHRVHTLIQAGAVIKVQFHFGPRERISENGSADFRRGQNEDESRN